MNTNSNSDNSIQTLKAPLNKETGPESRQSLNPLEYHNAPIGRQSVMGKRIPWQDMPDRKIRAKQQDLLLPDNSICTSKYTPVSFLPLNLIEQFSKLPNIYFFLMGFLQMVQSISTSGGEPILWFPLSIILMVTAIKDLFEDLKRKKDDNKENNSKTLRLTNNGFVQTTWASLLVGDIIQVKDGEFIPADILILKTSESNGSCYIETKNLDGETNLKFKNIDKKLLDYYESDTEHRFKSLVDCNYERPNPNLYAFNGSLDLLSRGIKVPLTNQNFLLRACSLRSNWVIGLVCYTGHDTKIMLNSISARGKSSKLERLMNKLIVLIFVLQIISCVFCSVFSLIWFDSNNSNLNYIEWQVSDLYSDNFYYFFTKFGNWLIIFTNFVPISLLVTLEMVKFVQGIFVTKDPNMCASFENSNTTVQTSRLMEELGQVEYIFSDKTGTLTCNIMEFKNLCVLGDAYGDNKEYEGGYSRRPVSNVDFRDERFFQDLKDPTHSAHEILTLLSTCHTINLDTMENKYSASSPDELALVNLAKYCGYEYAGTNNNDEILVQVKNESGNLVETRKFKLLHVLEFNSDRKRMSVVIEYPDGRLILFCKGADNVIWDRAVSCNYKQKIVNHLEIYSNKGLRTLLLAKKEIQRSFFEGWNQKYMGASCAIQNRDQEMSKLQEDLEKDMTVIGATAIEDKLQDAVGESIAAFKEAGIKVWVLTGDKVETAVNIGFSCRLLDKSQDIFQLSAENGTELNNILNDTAEKLRKRVGNKPYAIVVTGPTLIYCDTEELKTQLYDVCKNASVVLACRVSPKQKKDIVELVKNRVQTAVTLAIGDGANDVNMITAAHIGVGIRGLEGYQAARASDFAIGEFKLLKRLLFYYGRESYRKNSILVLYNFYKNMIYILPQFWNGFENGLSGNNLYESLLFQCFNIVFASFPIVIFATLDEDTLGDIPSIKKVSGQHRDLETHHYDCSEYLCKYPKLYTPGQRDNYFNQKLFWFWFGNGVVQAFFIQLASFSVLENTGADSFGRIIGFNTSGMEAFQILILVANFKILLFTNTYSVLVISCLILSNILYPISYLSLSTFTFFDYYEEGILNYNNWNVYFSMILGCVMTSLLDFALTRYLMEETLDENESKEIKSISNSGPISTAIEL